MAKHSLAVDSQLALPPMPVQPLDNGGESRSPNFGQGELPLEEAKAQIGRALKRTIHGSAFPLKEFGDPSHVNRLCDGEVPTPLARAWQRHRRELIRNLADESGLFNVRWSIEEREERRTA